MDNSQQPLQVSQSFEPLLPRSMDPAWEKIRKELLSRPDMVINKDSLDLLRSVHSTGLRGRDVVESLAYLSTTGKVSQLPSPLDYDQHVTTLATKCFAAPPRTVRKCAKLACLRGLLTLRTPLEAGWQLQEDVIHDTLRFITERGYVWEYLEHSDEVLLWELRAICLHEMDKRNEQVMLECVATGGDAAADFLWKQSKIVQGSVKASAKVVNSGIERTGDIIKGVIPPSPRASLLETSRHAKVVTLAYSGAAKRATNGARETSHHAFTQIQQASTQGIHNLACRFQDDKVGEMLVPHEPSREVLAAVGKVGIATVGAAAIVGDAIFESTKSVAQTTVATAVDVAQHRYGSSAGQVLRDSTDTAFNVLGIIPLTNVSVASFTKSVAKNTGKLHMEAYDENCLLGGSIIQEGKQLTSVCADQEVVEVACPSDALCADDSVNRFPVTGTTTATVDYGTDVISDLSSEPLHRRLQERNSIFRRYAASRNVDWGQEPPYAKDPLSESFSCDSSLDYSEAGTMEGTYISNDSLLELDDGIILIGKMIEQQQVSDEFLFEHVFEHAYDESMELCSPSQGICGGAPIENSKYRSAMPAWPQGIYSSIKSRLKL